MPRDLFAERSGAPKLNDMPLLERSEKSSAQGPAESSDSASSDPSPVAKHGSKDKIERDMDKQDAWVEIKPYTKSLTPSDVDACVKLEDATFPPQERATKEKVSSDSETCPLQLLCFKNRICLLVPLRAILHSACFTSVLAS